MSTKAALLEAKGWADELLDAEFKGRKDREKRARYDLAKRLDIAESYLFRLQYKFEEMTDVKGSVYRALMLGHQAYEAACRKIEGAADKLEARRVGRTENAVVESRQATGERDTAGTV